VWKVCLTSISHPNSFKTFLNDRASRKILIKHKGGAVHQYVLDHKTYTKEQLVDSLNTLFKATLVGEVKLTDKNKVEFKFIQDDTEFLASNYMLEVLGYNGVLGTEKNATLLKITEQTPHVEKRILFETDTVHFLRFQNEVNLDLLRPDYIIAYTNIVSPTIIGGIYSKILRVIPIKTSENEYVITEFHHKEFLELQNTEISEIEIELRSHDGSPIEFGFEQDIILNLEFKMFLNEDL
jgi:GR25 family glycosyltransferase involved in LPS biosynthesis